MSRPRPLPRPRRGQAGFTLVELMVSMTIGLIVVLGFTATFVNLKVAFLSQDKMSQLQDNERLSMALLTATFQEAGYFPNPAGTSQRALVLTADTTTTYGAMAAGQSVVGQGAGSSTVETFSTRYAGGAVEGLLNCVGGSVGNGVLVRNVFYVDSSTQSLGCKVTTDGVTYSSFYPLVSNVSSMAVSYGVDTDGDGNIDTYIPAASVAAAQWTSVKSARVTINFLNPNAATQSAKPTIAWVQTINLMNNQ